MELDFKNRQGPELLKVYRERCNGYRSRPEGLPNKVTQFGYFAGILAVLSILGGHVNYSIDDQSRLVINEPAESASTWLESINNLIDTNFINIGLNRPKFVDSLQNPSSLIFYPFDSLLSNPNEDASSHLLKPFYVSHKVSVSEMHGFMEQGYRVIAIPDEALLQPAHRNVWDIVYECKPWDTGTLMTIHDCWHYLNCLRVLRRQPDPRKYLDKALKHAKVAMDNGNKGVAGKALDFAFPMDILDPPPEEI